MFRDGENVGLKPLPVKMDAFEPVISAELMKLHHDIQQKYYV